MVCNLIDGISIWVSQSVVYLNEVKGQAAVFESDLESTQLLGFFIKVKVLKSSKQFLKTIWH